MLRESELVSKELIDSLMNRVWMGVGIRIIETQLAITTVKHQLIDFLTSHIDNSTENKSKKSVLRCDSMPKSTYIDTFANGTMEKKVVMRVPQKALSTHTEKQNTLRQRRKLTCVSQHRSIPKKNSVQEGRSFLVTLAEQPINDGVSEET